MRQHSNERQLRRTTSPTSSPRQRPCSASLSTSPRKTTVHSLVRLAHPPNRARGANSPGVRYPISGASDQTTQPFPLRCGICQQLWLLTPEGHRSVADRDSKRACAPMDLRAWDCADGVKILSPGSQHRKCAPCECVLRLQPLYG